MGRVLRSEWKLSRITLDNSVESVRGWSRLRGESSTPYQDELVLCAIGVRNQVLLEADFYIPLIWGFQDRHYSATEYV